jgi:signal transduction histidine kinase
VTPPAANEPTVSPNVDLFPIATSSDYRDWQERFIHTRLPYATAITGAAAVISALIAALYGKTPEPSAHVVLLLLTATGTMALLVALRLVPRNRGGSVKFLCLAVAIAAGICPVFTITFKSPFLAPSEVPAIGIATLIAIVAGMAFIVPVRWRMHVVGQAIIVGAYATLRVVFDAPTLTSYASLIGLTQVVAWGCIVATLSVVHHERLEASSFMAQKSMQRMNEDLQKRTSQLQETLGALRNAQADLVRAERMASVATLVRGIAHELNNPIGFIEGNMAVLRRYCDFITRAATALADGEARSAEAIRELTQLSPKKDLAFVARDLAKMTEDISEGARRAKLIISDLQGLTASQRSVEQVDLHRAVRQSVTLLSPRLPPGVQIESELEPVPSITARAGQVEQVLVNLLDNAIRAVGQKGTIRVRTAHDERSVILSVRDDGGGMSDTVRQRATEPFFTTRAPGEGSGLGLAIVASIIRAHRGTLDIKSAPGAGTEILIRLPAVTDTTLLAESSTAAASAPN